MSSPPRRKAGVAEKDYLNVGKEEKGPSLPMWSPVTAELGSSESGAATNVLSNLHGETTEKSTVTDNCGLPVPEKWDFRTFTKVKPVAMLERFDGCGSGTPLGNEGEEINELRGLEHRYCINLMKPEVREGKKMKGWQGPGPGARIGGKKLVDLSALKPPIMFALIHLVKEALDVEEHYRCGSAKETSSDMISFVEQRAAMRELEGRSTISRSMKRKIWSVAPQLGVPGFLLKLSCNPHALGIYLLPGSETNHWWCTACVTTELKVVPTCEHVLVLRECLQEVSSALQCEMEDAVRMLRQSGVYHQVLNRTTASFYGNSKKLEFAVVRSGPVDLDKPMDRKGRIQILRRLRKTNKWNCVALRCSGLASQVSDACKHVDIVNAHIEEELTTPFLSILELQERDCDGPAEGVGAIQMPRHVRPMIPSEVSFEVDERVNRDARSNETRVLKAASRCHCGCVISENACGGTARRQLRVETSRCYVMYLQDVWTCSEGHCVLPEEETEEREGLLWISKDTAFTEVFLFDMLLQMVLGGATIGSQADIRSQIMFLQTEYTRREDAPRSHQTVRKALTLYAMSVVKGMEDWVFRCDTCAVRRSDGVYYDKLSFDGLQIGFKIKQDMRYDFYGKKASHWRRGVERCSSAWQTSHLIESHALRAIVTEALRVRQVPPGCNSVHSLCRVMMNIPLQKKESIRAAVASIKLFDESWTAFLPTPIVQGGDETFEMFQTTQNPELVCHPIHFISKAITLMNYERGKHVLDVFHMVMDARKAAAILAVILTNLREDLKRFIPAADAAFLESYSSSSYDLLDAWLLEMAQRDSWSLIDPGNSLAELEESTHSGIAEHARYLEHPYRAPWSWKMRTESTEMVTPEDVQTCNNNMICGVRDVGDWKCPEEAVSRILLMLMALFNEPVSVWLRGGSFYEFSSAIEVLSDAERFCGRPDTSYHYRAALFQLQGCVVIYEGIMGIIGANDPSARPMHAVLRNLLVCVPNKFQCYATEMGSSEARNESMFSPSQFDDMLRWTGAVPIRGNLSEPDAVTAAFMRSKYERISAEQSDDFLETGVWAPDFPMRRPSPATTVWGGEKSLTEKACSKKYDVHNAFSPGTFGGYCLCRHAKTVLVMFLKQPEGCRMPLNFIIERCLEIPKYVIYDFACGTQKSALGLSTEIVRHTSFVVDPFHFPGHKTCSLAMHQSSYSDIRGRNTESQEQRNNAIRLIERTLRACRDVHFMHFVVLAHGYLNLKAMFRDHHDRERTKWGSRAWISWVRENLFEREES